MKLVVPLFMDLEKALQEKTDSQDKKPLTEFVCVLDSWWSELARNTAQQTYHANMWEDVLARCWRNIELMWNTSIQNARDLESLLWVLFFILTSSSMSFHCREAIGRYWMSRILQHFNIISYIKKTYRLYRKINVHIYTHTWCLLYTRM